MATAEEFLAAQADSWDTALSELRAGRKTTHWIWWIFPQLASLGRSSRARHFGLTGRDDAAAYLAHPVLGARLTAAAEALLAHAGTDPAAVLGETDAMKVRSSMTLFESVPGAPSVFAEVLDRLYDGHRCPLTQGALGAP